MPAPRHPTVHPFDPTPAETAASRAGTRGGRAPSLPSLLCLLAGLLVACAGDDREGGDAHASAPSAVVRDSAGVRVVEHQAATAEPTPVVDAAVVSLAREGDPDYLFAGISGVAALDRGRIAVAERDGTLRFYASGGALQGRAGGSGEGPGEFRFLSLLVRLPGDTLAAADPRRGRTMFFGPDGGYLDEVIWSGRTGDMPEGASQCFLPNVRDVRFDRGLVMWGHQCVIGEGTAGSRDYLADVLLVDADTTRSLARVPILTATEDPGADEPILRFRTPAVYGRPALAALDDLVLVAVPSLGHRIRGFRPDGSLALDLRDATPEPPLTAELRDAVSAGWPERFRSYYDDAPWPERLEGWDVLRVFGDGRLWARSLHLPADSTGEVWTAFSADGSGRTRYRLPARFRLHDVRDGRMWGVSVDALDVETVVAYPVPER